MTPVAANAVGATRRAVFVSATIGYSLYYVCRLSLSVLKAPLVQEGVLTESQLGLVGSGLFYAYAVGKFVNGFIADRANLNRLLTIGLLGAALVNLALGFRPGFALFAALWLLGGWFQSMGAPSCIVGLTRWFSREERSTYYGLWSATHNLGEALTFVAVAILSVRFGWRWGFWGAAAAGIVGAVIVRIWFKNRDIEPVDDDLSMKRRLHAVRMQQIAALRNGRLWLIAAASAFMYVSRYAINSWGVFFLELGKGYSRVEAGTILSLNATAGIVGTIASGWILDRWCSRNRFLPALCAGLLNAASLAAFLATPAAHPWIDATCMIGFGVSIGALICYLGGLLAIDTVPNEAAGAALGIVGIASYVGAGIQDVASGYLIEHSKHGVGVSARYDFVPVGSFWLGASVVSALVTALIWQLSRRKVA